VWTATLVNHPFLIRDYGDPLSGLPSEYTVYLSFILTVY
jgi:hypothetical protein